MRFRCRGCRATPRRDRTSLKYVNSFRCVGVVLPLYFVGSIPLFVEHLRRKFRPSINCLFGVHYASKRERRRRSISTFTKKGEPWLIEHRIEPTNTGHVLQYMGFITLCVGWSFYIYQELRIFAQDVVPYAPCAIPHHALQYHRPHSLSARTH